VISREVHDCPSRGYARYHRPAQCQCRIRRYCLAFR
jgi:hypothetical protein